MAVSQQMLVAEGVLAYMSIHAPVSTMGCDCVYAAVNHL